MAVVFSRALAALLLLGTASLVYFQRVTPTDGTFQLSGFRSDFVFALACVPFAGWLLTGSITLSSAAKRLCVTVFALLVLVVLAGIASTLLADDLYGVSIEWTSWVPGSKILLNGVIVLMVAITVQSRPNFLRWLAAALWIPPLIVSGLSAALLQGQPLVAGAVQVFDLSLLSGGQRFQGLNSNPYQAVINNLVALSFLWTYSISTFQGFSPRSLAALIGVFGLVAVVFLTLARIVLFALPCLLLVGVLVSAAVPGRGGSVIARCAAWIGSALFVFAAAWLVLPDDIHFLFESRLLGEGRVEMWAYYLGAAIENPLGAGFDYARILGFYDRAQANVPAHNAFLDVWMIGGPIALAATLGILWLGVRTAVRELSRQDVDHRLWVTYAGVVTALAGIWLVTLSAGVPFTDMTHGVLLGLVLAGIPSKRTFPVSAAAEVKEAEVVRPAWAFSSNRYHG